MFPQTTVIFKWTMMQLQTRCEDALSTKYTEFYSGHPAVFMNLKQIITVPSNRTTLFYSGMATCFGLKKNVTSSIYNRTATLT